MNFADASKYDHACSVTSQDFLRLDIPSNVDCRLDQFPEVVAPVGLSSDDAVSELSLPCQLEQQPRAFDYSRATSLSSASTSPSSFKHYSRPPNGFILFRRDFLKAVIPRDVEKRQERLSRVAGQVWGLMTEEQKSVWRKKSEALAKELAKGRMEFYQYRKHFRSANRRKDQDPASAEKQELEHASRLRELFTGFKGQAKPTTNRRTRRMAKKLGKRSPSESGSRDTSSCPANEGTSLDGSQLVPQTPFNQHLVFESPVEIPNSGHNAALVDDQENNSSGITSLELCQDEYLSLPQNPQTTYSQMDEQLHSFSIAGFDQPTGCEPMQEQTPLTDTMQIDTQFDCLGFANPDLIGWDSYSFEADQRSRMDLTLQEDKQFVPLDFRPSNLSGSNNCQTKQQSEYFPKVDTPSDPRVITSSSPSCWQSFAYESLSAHVDPHHHDSEQHFSQANLAVEYLSLGDTDVGGTTTGTPEERMHSDYSGGNIASDAQGVQAGWDLQSFDAMEALETWIQSLRIGLEMSVQNMTM